MLARSHTRYWPRSNHPSSNTCKMSQRYVRLTGAWERRFCSLLHQSSHVAWSLQIHISIFVSTNLRGDSLMVSHRQLYKSWWQAYFYMHSFHALLPYLSTSSKETIWFSEEDFRFSEAFQFSEEAFQSAPEMYDQNSIRNDASFLICISYTVLQ